MSDDAYIATKIAELKALGYKVERIPPPSVGPKPCPFCCSVGPRDMESPRDPEACRVGDYWIVYCVDCHAAGPRSARRSDAIERWNRAAKA